MRRLRGPNGCPWDREQNTLSLRRYVLEEAYEVVDAIDARDSAALCDELGDLLLQVVFLAQVSAEEGAFEINDVADAIVDKLVRRHPHVFGEDASSGVLDSVAVLDKWEAIKRAERAPAETSEASSSKTRSVLDGVGVGMPGLMRADKLGARASRIGFDWSDPLEVLEKVREETAELESAMLDERDCSESAESAELRDRVEQELGDLLLTVSSLARHLGLPAEAALRRANARFERRFRAVEAAVESGESGRDREQLERAWETAKD